MNNHNRKEDRSSLDTSQRIEKYYGIIGLCLAILACLFSVSPKIGAIIWGLGVLFCVLGLVKPPRAAAIAGLVISCIGLLVTLFFGALSYLGFTV